MNFENKSLEQKDYGPRQIPRYDVSDQQKALHQARRSFQNSNFNEAFDIYDQLALAYPEKATAILAEVYDKYQIIPNRDRYLCYQSRFFNFGIKPTDKVLDIGSGNIPFQLATHLADITIDDDDYGRAGVPFKHIDRKSVFECSIENLPFKDKEFDFVYCSHVLEHVVNPERACNELMRVAKRGYIETPTPSKDLWLNNAKVSHHRWAVENINGKLVFTEYSKEDIDGLQHNILRRITTDPQTSREKAFSSLIYLKATLFNTMLLWEDSFEYEIRTLTRQQEMRSPVTSCGFNAIPNMTSYKSNSSREPAVSFGIIVLNGEPFTKYCLRALYPFAHEIIVVEGASQKAKAISTANGHSTDGTLNSLEEFKRYEDPENKLKIITKDGFWSEKDEQSQAYAQVATGDYLWQVDIDEFYMPEDIDYILRLLRYNPEISAASFRQISFWGDICYKCDSTYLLRGGNIFHRLFKFGNGYKYVTHRPPTVVDPHGVDLRKKNYLSAEILESKGIYLYHYSLLFPKQVHDKVTYYKNLPGEQCPTMSKWAIKNYHHISNPYRIYNVHTHPGWLERYVSKHPPQIYEMINNIKHGNTNISMRNNYDVESFIDDEKYQSGIRLIKKEFESRPDKLLKITDDIFNTGFFEQFVHDKTFKIAQLNTNESRGGAARVSINLSKYLIENGCQVTKYVKNRDVGNNWVVRIFDDVLDNKVRKFCEDKGLQDYHIQSTFNLLKDSSFLSHDLFHFHNLHGDYFNIFALALLARLKPSVWTLHDMHALTGHCAHSFECDRWETGCGQCPDLTIYPSVLKDSTRAVWKAKKSIYESIDIHIVTPSYWLKSKVEKSILGEKPVRVIPNGIDLNIFKPTDKKLSRQLLRLPQDRTILAFAADGGLDNPWKGGKYLHEALKYLSRKHPDLLFLNIGGSINTKEYHVVNVPYIKNRNNLAIVYSACDIFAYPSVAETFGLVVLEALACGLPVVTFDTGGIPEIVKHGKSGIVTKHRNQSEFTRSLELLIVNPKLRNQFAYNAANNIRYEHSLEGMFHNYLNLYLELIYKGGSLQQKDSINSVRVSDRQPKKMYAEFAQKLLDVGNTLGATTFLKKALKTDELGMEELAKPDSEANVRNESPSNKTKDFVLSSDSEDSSPYLVSAIVSTYNSEKHIRGCLQDLENQTIADQLEIIVVNSGSQQNEEAIVKEFQQKYDNIKYIKTEQRETIYKAWNRGIKAASGKYITNANTDDRHRQNALEIMARALDENSDKVLVYANQLDVDEIGGRRVKVGERINGEFSKARLFEGQCPPGSQPMWRKDVHEVFGYFDESFTISGDYEFWFRLTQKFDFLYLNKALGERFLGTEAVSQANDDLLSWENEMVIRKCYEYALQEGMTIGATGISEHPAFSNWPEVNIWKQNTKAKLEGRRVSLVDNIKDTWDFRTNPSPKLTIVIVTYNRHKELLENLYALNDQKEKDFEVIIMDNGGDLSWLKQHIDEFNFGLCGIELELNFGPSPAKNIGTEFAKAEYIAFLDDDAVADRHLVRNIVEHFENYSICGLRGKVLPKTQTDLQSIPVNYDLGDQIITTACEVCSLSTFRKDVLIEMGGFDELLFGSEGIELSYRICKDQKEKVKSILYFPDVIVYHDHCPEGPVQTEKILRQHWMELSAWRKDNNITGYIELVHSLYPGNKVIFENNYNNYSWLINVALYLHKNFPEEAVKWAEKAVALRPDRFKGCYTLGSLYTWFGRYDEALTLLERIYEPLRNSVLNGGSELINSELKDQVDISECYASTCTKLAQCYMQTNQYYKLKQVYTNLLNNPNLILAEEQKADILNVLTKLDKTLPTSLIAEKKNNITVSAKSEQDYLVSAIVSTYNSEKFLKGCLDDLEHQTIADKLEIIVINSGSQENEEAIVREYQQKHNNIVYIETEQREGIYTAWNRAIKVARGTFLTNANTDDRHREDALEIMAETLLANPDVALAYGDQICTDTPNGTFTNHHAIEMARRAEYSHERLLFGCCVGSQPMWRKSLHNKLGYFDDTLTCAGDWDFWLRISISSRYKFKHIPEFLGLYYYNENGIEHGRKIHSLYERYIVGKRYGNPYISVIPLYTSKDNPLVSVIMPAYNAAEHIAEAIESVLIQNYRNFELIVVDDGSTDDTKDIVASFKDDKIKYLYKDNGGPSSARNLAINKAKGQYIMPLDADDMMTPDFIAKHLAEFEKHPDVDLVYCDVLLIGKNSNPIRIMNKPEYQDRRHLIRDLLRAGHPVVPFRLGIRRSVFDRIGFYDEDLLIGEDYDMMRRFVKAGLKEHHLSEPLHLRRMHADSLSGNQSAQKAKSHFEVIERFIDTFAYDELFPDVAWDQIAPQIRQLHAKCLTAGTYLAIGQDYVKTKATECSRTAFDLACSELNDCVKMDPGNQDLRQLLQKSKLIRARYTEAPQQVVSK